MSASAARHDRSGGEARATPCHPRRWFAAASSAPRRTSSEELHRRRFPVTQATVSRDIRELGLLRVHDDAGPRYMAPVAELDVEQTMQRLRNAIREHVQAIEFVDLFGIVHTAPGCAPLVGGALDGSRFEEVAGTIAGDDTVLVIARSRPAAQRLLLPPQLDVRRTDA